MMVVFLYCVVISGIFTTGYCFGAIMGYTKGREDAEQEFKEAEQWRARGIMVR
jgi:hypothetical protein